MRVIGVHPKLPKLHFYASATSLNRRMVDRTVAAEGVPKVYAPPA